MNKDIKAGFTTRAAVPPPRQSFLPKQALQNIGASNNMRDERLAPMTFNMPRTWHTKFKITAAVQGINMKDLLIQCFDAWEREQNRSG